MSISAAQVKELRERTGAGMMECKKALVEVGGDLEAAIEHMRKTGLAKADKKAGRTAAEGVVRVVEGSGRVAMVEVNCETDFVAKGDDFLGFVDAVSALALEKADSDLESLLASPLKAGAGSVAEEAKALVAKIGENIGLRRLFGVVSGKTLGAYQHGSRIGVVVEMEGGDAELAKDIAMHIAASRPVCVAEADVPAELIAKEREIYAAQAAESGKPAEIVEKMVDGRVKKYLKEVTLLGQPFVKDPDTTVEKLLAGKGASVVCFARFEVGEGIEKKVENFADEVMAQVRGS